jgi:hypothetical protein
MVSVHWRRTLLLPCLMAIGLNASSNSFKIGTCVLSTLLSYEKMIVIGRVHRDFRLALSLLLSCD